LAEQWTKFAQIGRISPEIFEGEPQLRGFARFARKNIYCVLYGSETWVLTRREENQLLVFERKVLRTISGPIIENGVYRRRYNFELDREFDNPSVINVVKTSTLRYAGHMIRKSSGYHKRLFS
jgi:hypothetical protein